MWRSCRLCISEKCIQHSFEKYCGSTHMSFFSVYGCRSFTCKRMNAWIPHATSLTVGLLSSWPNFCSNLVQTFAIKMSCIAFFSGVVPEVTQVRQLCLSDNPLIKIIYWPRTKISGPGSIHYSSLVKVSCPNDMLASGLLGRTPRHHFTKCSVAAAQLGTASSCPSESKAFAGQHKLQRRAVPCFRRSNWAPCGPLHTSGPGEFSAGCWVLPLPLCRGAPTAGGASL